MLKEIVSKDKGLSEKYVTIPDIIKYFIAELNAKGQEGCSRNKLMKNNAVQFLLMYYNEKDADILGRITGTEYSVLKKLLYDCEKDKKEERREDISQLANELSKKENLIKMLQFKNTTEKRLSIMNTGLAIISLIITVLSLLD